MQLWRVAFKVLPQLRLCRLLVMQNSTPHSPVQNGAPGGNGSKASASPPASSTATPGCKEQQQGDPSLDPKMMVMSGGDKEKAADYANCEAS